MKKDEVLKIIDEVMYDKNVDSMRNAVLSIREKVLQFKDPDDDFMKDYYARLRLRGNNDLCCSVPYFEGAKYVVIDTAAKIDTGIYGTYWYE